MLYLYILFYACSVLVIVFHCVVLCIVCVLMCTVLLPPSVNPVAVNKYIKYFWGGRSNLHLLHFCLFEPHAFEPRER